MKRLFRIFVAMFLGTVMGFGIAGCTDTQAEWQEVTDKNTFIVSVNITMLGGELTTEKLAPVKVKRIVPIEGVSPHSEAYSHGNDQYELALYSVRTRYASDEDLQAIRAFDFVDYAWRNDYDYRANTAPTEEKKYVEIQDHWYGFHGYYAVIMDKSFKNRIFTAKDFNLPNLKSVEWYTYDYFKRGDETLGHIFHVHISDYTDKAAKEGLDALYEFDYVKEVHPAYAINDGQM